MKTIDLFAGCGGMSMGFQKAGFNIVKAYDNWDAAIDCYRLNFNHEILNVDLSNYLSLIDNCKELNPELLIGGPPCQDFSHAGKRTEGQRANLTESFAKIVAGLMPTWFVMENVERTINSLTYRVARTILKSAGFGITEIILDASYYGVPQKRKRFFSIGKIGESDNFLNDLLVSMRSDNPLTVRNYFGEKINFEFYYRHPRNYNRRAIFSIDEPAPTMRGVNRPVPAGYKGHKGDPVPISNKIKSLTTKERAMIQTFPKDFVLIGSKTNIEQMIGNAVPVNLAFSVGSAIMKYNYGEWKANKIEQLAMNF